MLSHEETLALIKQAQDGDDGAKETLVTHNIALVKSILKGFLGRGVDFDDLLQIGSIGLLKAIKGFSTDYNVRFSTYAVPLITGEIKRFLRDDGMIKVSRSLKENAIKVYHASEALKKKLGRDPTLEELSVSSGLSREDIVSCLDAARDPISIDQPIASGDNDLTLLDTLVSTKEEAEQTIDRILLKELLSGLEPRERQIVMLRYFSDKTQSEIANTIGISQVQVSRLLQKILTKLKMAANE